MVLGSTYTPIHPVSPLYKLNGHELLRLCVACQLHKPKASMAEICNLGVARCLPQRIRVGWRLHTSTHAAGNVEAAVAVVPQTYCSKAAMEAVKETHA